MRDFHHLFQLFSLLCVAVARFKCMYSIQSLQKVFVQVKNPSFFLTFPAVKQQKTNRMFGSVVKLSDVFFKIHSDIWSKTIYRRQLCAWIAGDVQESESIHSDTNWICSAQIGRKNDKQFFRLDKLVPNRRNSFVHWLHQWTQACSVASYDCFNVPYDEKWHAIGQSCSKNRMLCVMKLLQSSTVAWNRGPGCEMFWTSSKLKTGKWKTFSAWKNPKQNGIILQFPLAITSGLARVQVETALLQSHIIYYKSHISNQVCRQKRVHCAREELLENVVHSEQSEKIWISHVKQILLVATVFVCGLYILQQQQQKILLCKMNFPFYPYYILCIVP